MAKNFEEWYHSVKQRRLGARVRYELPGCVTLHRPSSAKYATKNKLVSCNIEKNGSALQIFKYMYI